MAVHLPCRIPCYCIKRAKTAHLLARQYAAVSSQVIDQKRVVADNVYSRFYGDWNATDRDYVRYLHELDEYNVFYSRMQNVRSSLDAIGEAMAAELNACKAILKIED